MYKPNPITTELLILLTHPLTEKPYYSSNSVKHDCMTTPEDSWKLLVDIMNLAMWLRSTKTTVK